jgi:hypothetical protein
VTPFAAAATHPPAPWWVLPALAAGLVIWLALYAVACAVWPYTRCRRCHGTGRIPSPSGRAHRLCRKCKSSGRRLRFGRWIHNYVSAHSTKGT